MLIRIVKMIFKEELIAEFQTDMQHNVPLIRATEGCEYLQILRDKKNPNMFFTYSHWKDETSLNNYRNSGFFAEIWPKAKAKFAEKPEAWSVDQLIEMT